jgi:hypothetical protein
MTGSVSSNFNSQARLPGKATARRENERWVLGERT